MAASAPVLAGQTLAMPQEYTRKRQYRGGRQTMLDGSTVVDLVSTSAKHMWELSWPLLTDAQASTLQTAFDALKDTSGAYTDIDGAAYTVSLDGVPEVTKTAVKAAGAGNVRWSVSITLRQE